MSREIKFRAWLKDDKRMVEIRSIDFHEEGNIITVNYNDIFGFEFNENEIELMQYTGLKDKNGKEIYEGDILLVANGSINGDIMFSKRVVKWFEEKRGYNIHNFDNVYKPTHYYEVIGNVYQHPELLEENYE